MLESASIRRRTGTVEEHGFDALKSEGIRLAQELAGRVWTDYNLHDPGVTILEQLCYALTDLIYRAGFETADYLTGEAGYIDYDRQALYRPEAIFSSAPVTTNDYRKIIFDAVPEIDNVWVKPVIEGPAEGLYRIYAQLAQGVDALEREGGRDRVIERIKAIYTARRNLCEDLAEVRIIERRDFSLYGTIEVDSQREPAEVLAEIYFRAARLLSSSIPSRSYTEILRQGKSLEEIFTGPLTERVYIAEEDLERERESVTVSDMIGIISAIPGVRYIDRLWFQDDQAAVVDSIPYDPSLEYVPRLRLPAGAGELGVTLRRNEREYRVSFRELEWALDRRYSEYRARRQTRQDFADVYALPQGEFREVRSYYSVQNHFPNTYGINQYGLPAATPPRRKAQAANLKAYLLFFEQIMANFLENLQEIPRLFSLDQELGQSYFYQALDNGNAPNVEDLYRGEPSDVLERVAGILGRYDNFEDRRNRILDYLLALYGETFNEESVVHFDFYADEAPGQAMIRHKINLLKTVGGLV